MFSGSKTVASLLTIFSYLSSTNAATSIKRNLALTQKTNLRNEQTSNKTKSNNSKTVSRISKDSSERNYQSKVLMISRKIMTSLM